MKKTSGLIISIFLAFVVLVSYQNCSKMNVHKNTGKAPENIDDLHKMHGSTISHKQSPNYGHQIAVFPHASVNESWKSNIVVKNNYFYDIQLNISFLDEEGNQPVVRYRINGDTVDEGSGVVRINIPKSSAVRIELLEILDSTSKSLAVLAAIRDKLDNEGWDGLLRFTLLETGTEMVNINLDYRNYSSGKSEVKTIVSVPPQYTYRAGTIGVDEDAQYYNFTAIEGKDNITSEQMAVGAAIFNNAGREIDVTVRAYDKNENLLAKGKINLAASSKFVGMLSNVVVSEADGKTSLADMLRSDPDILPGGVVTYTMIGFYDNSVLETFHLLPLQFVLGADGPVATSIPSVYRERFD